MSMIFHITRREQWTRAKRVGLYMGDTLGTEGFIHSSTPQQVLKVANRVFRGRKGLVLLCIDPEKVRPEIRYEAAQDGEEYPHIYGPLNVDAVVQALKFEPGEDGTFVLPKEAADAV
jgi:uncharacterized protein (DUF952 family)